MIVFRVAHDADFVESEHPRDNDGKFATSAGGGASGEKEQPSPPKQTYTSTAITPIMVAGGFKKQKQAGPDGEVIYWHPVGGKVVIHPAPEGQKFSSKWTAYAGKKGEEKEIGKGAGPALAKLLGIVVQKAKEKKAEQAVAEQPDKKALMEPLVKLLNIPKSNGYVPASTNTPSSLIDVYEKSNGSKLQINYQTTEWLAQTPGHVTKEGVGAENLAALLSGKPAIIPPGGEAPWKNSSKTIGSSQQAPAEVPISHVQPSEGHVKVMEKLIKAAPKPTNAEASAVASYSGSAYEAINTKLRHDPDSPVTPTIKEIDSFLAKSSIPEDVTLYREVSGEYSKILKSILCDGCSFIDRGFISTSPHPGVWHGDLTIVIKVPAGSKGAAIKHLSVHSHENEVLLPRGTKLNVTKLDLANNRIEVEVEQEHMKKAAA